ncbi:MAG: hypothetical protein ACHQFZ_02535 [Acidimicrobiales bacterium]
MTRRDDGVARPFVALILGVAVLVGSLTAGVVLADNPTTTSSPTSTTTTTTVPRERPQAGWAVAADSGRGVMVDVTTVRVGAASFRVARFRARATLLRWHVGLGDPAAWSRAPADAAPSIDWTVEGPPGVLAVFNGGFKQHDSPGGAMADGLTLEAPVRGRMTIAVDAAGHWAMGVWGAAGFPPAHFRPVSYRQNLGPLVAGGAPTPAASAPVTTWGSPLGGVPAEPRTGLGVDRNGNLLFVATMSAVLPIQLARALLRAGAVSAMELDINPYWPILGVALRARHHPAGGYAIGLAGSQHSPTVYDTGWIRDFFVVLAEPSTWGCEWTGPGLHAGAVPQPQPLRPVGRCAGVGSAVAGTRATTTAGPGR